MTQPPKAVRGDTVRRVDDFETADPYAWLRAQDWQRALRDPETLEPAIRRHLEAENAYTESVLAPIAGLRERLKAELRGRLPEREASVPQPDGSYAYYTRYEEGQQHPLWCRCPADSVRDDLDAQAGEELLLDGNAAAEGHPFFRVPTAWHSPDHRYVAFAVDRTGSEYHRLQVLDTLSGELRDLGAEALQGDLAWANDSRTLLYSALDANHRPSRVYRTAVDDPRHALLYEETDPAFYLGVGKTESRRWLTIGGADHSDTTEIRVLDADRPEGEPALLHARTPGLDVRVATHGEQALLLTNADGAQDYKIVAAPLADPRRANWQDLVPHRPGVLIKGMQVFVGHLVRLELADALPRIVVRDLATGAEHAVAFEAGDPAYALGLGGGPAYDTATLRLSYSSPRTPQRTYDYDMAARRLTLRKEQQVPSGHDPAHYTVERRTVASDGGARVPVTLLYRSDCPPSADRPVLLYGYGAYGMAVPASFSPQRFGYVDRGMVYAIAHVRGGTDCGYGWYLDGKLENKTNTFKDFIAVADALVERGEARAGNIVAQGRSAGGMLMGVIANWRPELWRAVVAGVPFVDVFNTMCDDSLPLTPPEWSEWGDPLHDPEARARIHGYSPYDNVAERAYPHVLATAGIADPRVTYWEPAKWVAALRAHQRGDGLILLHTNMSAGHGGAAGRFAQLDELALEQGFVLWVWGLADAEA